MLSHGNNSQVIYILNSCPVHNLLRNPKYLNQLDVKLSPQDCSLVLVIDELKKQILSNLDMDYPISHYTSMTNKPIHFQITILIQIIFYEDKREMSIPIFHRNITIR